MVLEKPNNYMKKNETQLLSHNIHKKKLKMHWRFKCKAKSIKILEENIVNMLFAISLSNFLEDLSL